MKDLGTVSIRLGVLAEQLDTLFLHSFFHTPGSILKSSPAERVGNHYTIAAACVNSAAHLAMMLNDQLIKIIEEMEREVPTC